MKLLNKLFIVVAILLMGQYAIAQPPARKRAKEKEKTATAATYTVPMSERAKSQYPAMAVPTDVVWKRDIYRILDLTKEKNASLYYPVEPMGNSMNLFTYIFRLIIDKSINAYSYSLDGYENFTSENIINPEEMLKNYRIEYEFGEDSALIVNPSDIPSGEVLSYYVKESYYFDQRTSTYNQRVTAICPVLHRAGEFSSQATQHPMFWLNYDEIAQLLSRQNVMASSYNNISSMSLDDYFTKHSYDGEIYKTVNLRNLALSQYCKDSTEIKKEQAKIEKQLTDFHSGLWNPQRPEPADSLSGDSAATTEKDSKKSVTRRQKSEKKEKKVKESSSSGSSKSSSSPRVSVRRQRR